MFGKNERIRVKNFRDFSNMVLGVIFNGKIGSSSICFPFSRKLSKLKNFELRSRIVFQILRSVKMVCSG